MPPPVMTKEMEARATMILQEAGQKLQDELDLPYVLISFGQHPSCEVGEDYPYYCIVTDAPCQSGWVGMLRHIVGSIDDGGAEIREEREADQTRQ